MQVTFGINGTYQSPAFYEPPALKITTRIRQGSFGKSTGLRLARCVFLLITGAAIFCAQPGCDSKKPKPNLTPQGSAATDQGSAATNQDDAATEMRAAIAAQDWQSASKYSQAVLITHATDPDLITDVARVEAMLGRKRPAAQLLVDAASVDNYQDVARTEFAMRALIEVGELYKAIELLEKTLEVHPENNQLRRILTGFLGEAERNDRIEPHLKKLITNRNFDVAFLAAMTETWSRRFSTKTTDTMLERNPEDRRVRLGEASELFHQRNYAETAKVLEDILAHHTGFAPAHAMLGQVLVQQGRTDELDAWVRRTPEGSREFADYWITLGDIAAERGVLDSSARAYWEATQRDPNHSTAWNRLKGSLRQLRDSDNEFRSRISEAQITDVDERIEQLLELRKQFYGFAGSDRKSQRFATQVAATLLQLGRTWEAEAWSAIATTLTEDPTADLTSLRQRIVNQLRRDDSWLSRRGRPALAMDLSDLPMPSADRVATVKSRQAVVPVLSTSDHLRLIDASDQWGIGSVGSGNNPTDARLAFLIRSTGVGGGIIDFERDGHPDVVVMGAGGTMLESDSQPNELLRNVDSRFAKVTSAAGVGDRGFGQGVGVGDFNEDGFADLFFANLGQNRLLRNNGDGTFTDCSEMMNDADARRWTTCGVFVDINADGVTDLLTTNYCQPVAELEAICPTQEGLQAPCERHPLKFPADDDQFFAATGDGQFRDASSSWIGNVSPGRGLGIVAGWLDGLEQGVFIANDMTANAFYSRRDNADDQTPLIESAAARGLAVDARTMTQASMGIASSDFDGDGDLDFYVTGFAREYNIFYEQVSPGLWVDRTNRLGLIPPTLSVVGFGTEAIDMDNDGVEEIAVTNGHIGDFREPDSVPLEQPFQIFRRAQSGGFTLVQDDSWG
ncbi:MAG: hypothetical protein HKN47_10625, partial [Pirellulaceae bacterium]|nr:hypothetical protein [Pirellulaceae bacterium]